MEKQIILYRYEGYSEYSLKYPMKLKVHRETEHKYVVYDRYIIFPKRKEKFISKTGKKRFAYPTKEEAMVNYIARKRSQIEWCVRNIHLAEKGLFNAGESVSTALKEKVRLEELLDDY